MRTVKLFVSATLISSLISKLNGIPRFLERLRESDRILETNWRNMILGDDKPTNSKTVLTQFYGQENKSDDQEFKSISEMGHDFLSDMVGDVLTQSYGEESPDFKTLLEMGHDFIKEELDDQSRNQEVEKSILSDNEIEDLVMDGAEMINQMMNPANK